MPVRGGAVASRDRDQAIDLWRGLAMIFMAWVHLLGYGVSLPGLLDDAVREHLRFSAGAFVALAGMTVATAFGPALAQGGAAAARARRFLWRRALLLLLLDRLVGVGRVLVDAVATGAAEPAALRAAIVPLLTFREAGVTGGLLLLYALLLGAAPALIWLQRRAGGMAVVGGSLAAYAVAVALRSAVDWSAGGWCFPVAFWQPLFVLGLVAPEAWERVRRGGARRVAAWAAGATVAYGLLLVGRHGAFPGFEPLGWDFTKVPLLPAEMLRYVLTSQLVFAWAALAGMALPALAPLVRCLQLVGRQSLVVYVAHLFVEVPIAAGLWAVGPTDVRTGVALVLDAAALVAVAGLTERLKQRAAVPGGTAARVTRVALPRGAVVGTAVAVASMLAAVAVPRPDAPAGEAEAFVEEPVEAAEVTGDALVDPGAPPEAVDATILVSGTPTSEAEVEELPEHVLPDAADEAPAIEPVDA